MLSSSPIAAGWMQTSSSNAEAPRIIPYDHGHLPIGIGRSQLHGGATCRRCRLMVGQQLPTEIDWQGEHRGRGLTLNAFVTTFSASGARHADGPQHTPRDAELCSPSRPAAW